MRIKSSALGLSAGLAVTAVAFEICGLFFGVAPRPDVGIHELGVAHR